MVNTLLSCVFSSLCAGRVNPSSAPGLVHVRGSSVYLSLLARQRRWQRGWFARSGAADPHAVFSSPSPGANFVLLPWQPMGRARTAHPAGAAAAARPAGPVGRSRARLWWRRAAGDAAQPGGPSPACSAFRAGRDWLPWWRWRWPNPSAVYLPGWGAVAGGLRWRPAGDHAAHTAGAPGPARPCPPAAVSGWPSAFSPMRP